MVQAKDLIQGHSIQLQLKGSHATLLMHSFHMYVLCVSLASGTDVKHGVFDFT